MKGEKHYHQSYANQRGAEKRTDQVYWKGIKKAESNRSCGDFWQEGVPYQDREEKKKWTIPKVGVRKYSISYYTENIDKKKKG